MVGEKIRIRGPVDGLKEYATVMELEAYGIPTEPGDCDIDADVDATDLATLGMNWAPAGGEGEWSQGDFDGDGDGDATDLATLGMNWAPDGLTPIPEPATFGLLLPASLALLRRRR